MKINFDKLIGIKIIVVYLIIHLTKNNFKMKKLMFNMKKLMGVILLSTWTFLFIFFCCSDGPIETPFKITSPILFSICFFVLFFTTPILSIYLMKNEK
jgi:hypothetical protein